MNLGKIKFSLVTVTLNKCSSEVKRKLNKLENAALLLALPFAVVFKVKRTLGQLKFPYNTNQLVKGLIDIDSDFCADFEIRYF